MGRMVDILLWAWIVLDSGECSVSVPEITDEKFIDECVREHNTARSSVNPRASNMLYMSWDEGLAVTARAWARHCVFEHNTHLKDVGRMHPTFSSVGENLWVAYGYPSFNVTQAIKKWVDEKHDYDYNSNGCTDVCGHYTQVVWSQSYKVGCAVHVCPNGIKKTSFSDREGMVFVCNYAPAGNINYRKPYESQGEPCSGCKDICVDKLCHNKVRDSQKRYKWTPDWDPAPDGNGSNYMPILIARPIALVFTFITAYAVRYFYPDVFCYE